MSRIVLADTTRADTKPCIDCGQSYERGACSSHEWRMTRRCLRCADEHLRWRLVLACALDVDTDCWLWQRSTRNGYGQLSVRDETEYAHRLSYRLFVGPLNADEALHDCDVRRCIRPDHLFRGTQAENIADMIEKGRARHRTLKGEAHPNATLSDDEVAALRALWATGQYQQRALAARYGVAQSTVWRLVHGVTRAQGAA